LFTLATESKAESESESETIQCESKSGIGVRRIRRVSFSSDSAFASFVPIHTRSELSSDSDLAYDSASVASVASVNQP